MNVDEVREAVHRTSLRMVDDGLVIGSAGNISARLDDGRIVVTAAGVPYHRLTPGDHPVVTLADGTWHGPLAPTSELAIHLGVMRALPDVGAIVHTHSRYAAAFAVARLDLPFICNESIATRSERVLVTDYEPPGSNALADQTLRALGRQAGSRAVLLANHGVVAIGPSIDDAYLVAHSVEWTAEICHLARTLVAAGEHEHVLGGEVRRAIARTYGVSFGKAQT